jgi:hypothetical protein
VFCYIFDSSKRCVCPLYKFLYAFKVVKLFLKHPVTLVNSTGSWNQNLQTASHSFIQNVQEAFDKQQHVAGIFLDISKAYDVINHNRLLDKLVSYVIRGLGKKWFQSYLTNRIQFVEITQREKRKHIQYRFQS